MVIFTVNAMFSLYSSFYYTVLGCKNINKANQCIYPMKRQDDTTEGQRWKLDDEERLVLMDQPELGIVNNNNNNNKSIYMYIYLHLYLE
jgi:hypothetical protein